jgi:hypothetical protein
MAPGNPFDEETAMSDQALSDRSDLRLWPKDAGDGYVAAREALLDAEIALTDQRERVAALRRALPLGPRWRSTRSPKAHATWPPTSRCAASRSPTWSVTEAWSCAT